MEVFFVKMIFTNIKTGTIGEKQSRHRHISLFRKGRIPKRIFAQALISANAFLKGSSKSLNPRTTRNDFSLTRRSSHPQTPKSLISSQKLIVFSTKSRCNMANQILLLS